MVYDCFQFFNELDILKIRLNVLSPVVDKFVISEATETFSGLKKPLYYEENKELFAAFARSCQALGCPTLQPNVISPEALTDAKVHPEKHRDLIVRVSGLSAYFVALPEKIQDEIIKRNQNHL